jgi:hypothetical protein
VSYLDELKAQATHTTAKSHATVTPHVPLEQQIASILADTPPIARHRPWSVSEILPRLTGRYRERPATRDVAKALTALGWRQQRCWRKQGANRRFWYPPEGVSR